MPAILKKTRRIFVSFLLILSIFYAPTSFAIASECIDLQIIGANDFHGQLTQSSKKNDQLIGTAATLATYIKQQKQLMPDNTLVVHSGDMVGGSPPISALLDDEPTVDVMNQIAFDVGTPGNHEFDRGSDHMLRLIHGGWNPKQNHYFQGATFPYISANIVKKDTQELLFPPSLVKNIAGIKIGFIGVTTKLTPQYTIPDSIKNIAFLDEVDAINHEANLLKQQGVNILIVLAHEGGFQDPQSHHLTGRIQEIAEHLNPTVDIIFAGHSHSYINTQVNHTLILEAENYGKAISVAHVRFNKDTKQIVSTTGEIKYTYQKNATPDPKVTQIVEAAQQKVAPLINKKIGETTVEITRIRNDSGESALGNLIADAQRSALHTDFAFTNAGGIRADLPKGTVTWGDLYAVQPFNNSLVSLELTGEQIRKALNQQFTDPYHPFFLDPSGLTFTYDPDLPAPNRIVDIRKTDGTPLISDQTYTVTINQFLLGGDGFSAFLEGKNQTLHENDLDALVQYIRQLSQPFASGFEGRIRRVTS